MHAMQYEIPLPADYDMGIIRHRVATRGSALDDWAGLGVKAYLIRERGVDVPRSVSVVGFVSRRTWRSAISRPRPAQSPFR